MLDSTALDIAIRTALHRIAEEYGPEEAGEVWRLAKEEAGTTPTSVVDAVHAVADRRHPESVAIYGHEEHWRTARRVVEAEAQSGREDY